MEVRRAAAEDNCDEGAETGSLIVCYLRNTKQAYDAFGPLMPTRMTARWGRVRRVVRPRGRGPGPDLRGRRSDRDLTRRRLAPWKYRAADYRQPEQISRTDHDGQLGYWRSYSDDDVFYGHVLGCKGLERPAVVLCVNDAAVRDRAREKLYVGMSRATDQLIVVGDPGVVREIGGPAVAARLGV